MTHKSHIEKLIQEMCPNGVNYMPLGEVCRSSMGEFVHKDKQNPNALYPVYNGGITNTGYYDQYNTIGPKVIISARGAAGFVNKVEGNFWAGNSCHVITIKDETILNWEYLYYALKTQEKEIIGHQQKGGGVPAVSKVMISELSIPLPPVAIQEEIVRILDAFANLIENIDNEIKERERQLELTREALFSNVKNNCIEWTTLGQISKKVVSGGTPSRKIAQYFNGNIPWLRTQEIDWRDVYDTEIHITEEAVKNSAATIIPANCLIIAMYGATAGKACINRIPLTTNQACCNLVIDENKAFYKYAYYWVCKEYLNIKGMGEGSQDNINGQKVKSYPIPLPPLAEQRAIAEKLDTIEAFIANLKTERDLRQQQYEYYREYLINLLK